MEGALKQSKLGNNIPTSESSILPVGFSCKVKVVKIYDGDTCHVHLIYTDGSLRRFVCRLAGINTPEIGQPNSLIARDYLAHLCTGGGENSFHPGVPRLTEPQLQRKLDDNGSLVFATFHGTGYYKRALVTLQRADNSQKSFNTMLLEHGWAKAAKRQGLLLPAVGAVVGGVVGGPVGLLAGFKAATLLTAAGGGFLGYKATSYYKNKREAAVDCELEKLRNRNNDRDGDDVNDSYL